MKYAVIYQSETGNTEEIAKNIFVSLPGNDITITDAEKMTELPQAENIFQHNDGVVDHHADAQRKAAERHQVQRNTKRIKRG